MAFEDWRAEDVRVYLTVPELVFRVEVAEVRVEREVVVLAGMAGVCCVVALLTSDVVFEC